MPLTEVEVRILGSLIEKESVTPDNYPLSLNSLTAAGNQLSNREPVMQLDENTVKHAVNSLRQQSLVRAIQPSDSRVMKFQHLATDKWNLDRETRAVLCVLMLRGPQTLGEIKGRTGRLADFAELADVDRAVAGLISQQLAIQLPRRPGQKEVRYAHLLSGEPINAEDRQPEIPVAHGTRPLRYSINVTLDGCCDHRAFMPDDDIHRHAAENIAKADALLFGRVTYEMMEAGWRGPAQPGARPAWMEPFARTIDAAKKYVVSSTLDRVDWNAELVRGELGKAVQQLKQEPGKGLFTGGVTLPLALAELGLIDEYEFVVHPRVAGHGPTLFAGLSKPLDLKLVSRLEFGSGVVAMRYIPRKQEKSP